MLREIKATDIGLPAGIAIICYTPYGDNTIVHSIQWKATENAFITNWINVTQVYEECKLTVNVEDLMAEMDELEKEVKRDTMKQRVEGFRDDAQRNG